MNLEEPNSSPSGLSDDALAKMISDARTTISNIPESSAEVADRLTRFNKLYEALATKPDAPALMYKDPTGSTTSSAIGNRLLVGRSPKPAASDTGSVLAIRDEEMSRQHFAIVREDGDIYVAKDLNSLNGTYFDGQKQETAILIGGSEIRAGKTIFIFTGA